MASERPADGTVGKALDVLELVAGHGAPVRFSDLLSVSDHPKATLYRLLQTLTNQQMLRHDAESGTYSLGVRLVRLAHSAWSQSSLAPIARPHIDALSQATGETIHLAQLDAGHVLYVDKRNAARAIEMFAQAGRVGPAYCTGVGKAMLAHLDPGHLDEVLKAQSFHRHTANTIATAVDLRAELARIRARGYAFDREEHEPGIICCAVPILSRIGKPIGGLSITSSTNRATLEDLETHADKLLNAAGRIAEDAESWRFPERI
ncbi:IclR family transcriptional regulator [Jannaschia rubra]|uniref:IclR family transcriptional regulator n=1 Tax=Jannaschia rubra TaxID=282197 RepID=UPI002491A343|nr:IclR family transcriptional regulator [Jannaschia rubra]